jgi:hypothetical protein
MGAAGTHKEVKRIFTLQKVIQCRQALFCVVVLTAFNGATSVVGIATLYRLHGPGIESRWVGPKFCVPVQTGSGVYPASYSKGTWCFPGVKQRGATLTTHPIYRRG